MEPAANWSRLTRRDGDAGTTAALRTLCLFTFNESTNIQSRSGVEGSEGVTYFKVWGGCCSSENKRSKPDVNRKLWFSIGASIQGGTAGCWDSKQPNRNQASQLHEDVPKRACGFLMTKERLCSGIVPHQRVSSAPLLQSRLRFEIFTNFCSISQKHFSYVVFYFITSPTKVLFSQARQT